MPYNRRHTVFAMRGINVTLVQCTRVSVYLERAFQKIIRFTEKVLFERLKAQRFVISN